ncbi:Gonadal protein gdl [Sergentomyia squamirostris]
MQENSDNFEENSVVAPEEDFIDSPSPEYLQRKLYFLLEHLKNFHAVLPESYQMRIPYELLTGLANSLLNDTIFEIVKGLMEIQHVTEKHLEQLRQQVETEHNIEVQEWMSKIQDEEELDHILNLMKIKHDQKMKETDIKLVLHLDQKVKDQQSTLERAGVPGFYVTDNPKDIKIQMHLLDFILRLSKMKFELK